MDSDDRLVEDALDIFKRHWEGIPGDHRLAFAGVEGLMRDLRTGTLESDPFPRPVIDSNFLEVEYGYRLRGERRYAIRLVVAREYPLPVIAGEKEMRESVIFARMAHRYRFRYLNEVDQEKELLPDSLSAHGVRRRRSNPMSFRLAFMELLNRHRGYLTPAQRYACAVRYVRYSVSGGVDLRGCMKRYPLIENQPTVILYGV